MKPLDILCPPVSGRYGAPMGRPNVSGFTDRKGDWHDLEVTPNAPPFFLLRIPINAGGYDRGGVYWGSLAHERLYGFVGPSTNILGFVWASSRDEAKRKVRAIHPHARFFR